MPYKKKTGIRKVRGRRYGAVRRRYGLRRRRYGSNAVTGGPNTCKIVETLPNVDLSCNTPYLFLKAGISGPRASAVAPEFGLYRIAKITYRINPLYDTYTSTAPGGNAIAGVPQLYWKMNRYADAPAVWDGDYLRQQGAKPHRLDDKSVTISYRPNILLANAAAGSDSGQVKMTPWLSTDTAPDDQAFALSTTEHQGHMMWIECPVSGSPAEVRVAKMDVTIVYEFKNPRSIAASSSNSAPLVKQSL